MRVKLFLLMVFSMLVVTSSANAAIIFSDDFSSISGWDVDTYGGGGSVTVKSVLSDPSASGTPYARLKANGPTLFSAVSMERTVDATGFENISVSGWSRSSNQEIPLLDTFLFRWRKTGSAVWNIVSLNSSAWSFGTLSLPGYVENGLIDFSFYLQNTLDFDSDYGFIDDFIVRGDVLPGEINSESITVTPEPATMALFASGLLGMAGFRRKRKIS